jgi:uncharacterized protein YcnI
MRTISGAKRALITVAATGAAMTLGLLSGAGPASAHVHVDAEDAAPGAESVLTFHVPNESEKGALTTQLSVALPNVASASTELMPGWAARLDRDAAAGTAHSVTWTAAPGTGIPPDQFALFRISVKLPDTKTASFPATQSYSDGTVVKWDQPTPPGGAEPEYPVPTLDMTGAKAEPTDDHQTPTAQTPAPTTADNSARWLAGGALTVAALALVAAVLARRRS